MLFMSCVCHTFPVCSLLPCSYIRERADFLAPVCDAYCDCVTFPLGILGQVRYLIVSIHDPCCLSYFEKHKKGSLV